MNAKDLKEQFLKDLKDFKHPGLTDADINFVNFITQKIIDKKCKHNSSFIVNSDLDSSYFMAIALDAFNGNKSDITVSKIVRLFASGELPYGTGIDLKTAHGMVSIEIF